MFGTSYLSPGGVRAAFDHSFGSSLPIWLLDVVELLLGFCPLPDPVEGRTLGLPVEFPPLSSVNDWAVSEDSGKEPVGSTITELSMLAADSLGGLRP